MLQSWRWFGPQIPYRSISPVRRARGHDLARSCAVRRAFIGRLKCRAEIREVVALLTAMRETPS